MGTELVPFKTWEEYQAWHRNMLRQSNELPNKVTFTLFFGCALILGVLYGISLLIDPTLSLFCFIGLVGIFLFERVAGPKALRRKQINSLPNTLVEFPCPHCFENFNLGAAWVCGWCKERHLDWLPGSSEFRTPIQGCSNNVCENTRIHSLSIPTGSQAALQCPNCHRHIVLDPPLYEQKQCHISPFNGVSRMYGDTSEPVSPRPIQSVYPTPPGKDSVHPEQGGTSSYFNKRTDDV
jgi:xanthosine utilization system XapX-like protein